MGQKAFYNSIANYYEHLFPLNNQQIDFIQSEFDSLENFYFLDVGCSTGQLANQLCQLGAVGAGIDLNAKMINRAVELYDSTDLSFRLMDMLTIGSNYAQNSFDCLICFGNTLVHLESVVQIKNFLEQCSLLLKPGGKLLLQILNYEYILRERIAELPVIENEFVRFERNYDFSGPHNPKLNFKTRLIVKPENRAFENSTLLVPIQKTELGSLLLLSGFTNLQFYDGFDKRPFVGKRLPLVLVAKA